MVTICLMIRQEKDKITKKDKIRKIVTVVPKKTESANAVESDSKSEAAFSAINDPDSDEADDFADGDWFDEVAMLDPESWIGFLKGK